MEITAYSFPSKAQKKDKRDCYSCQFGRTQPQILFYGEIGKQHTRQENHKLHVNASFRNI